MNEKAIYLIDGNSLLYRSFYAIQRLTNSQGFPTNAIYGFINTLRKLIQQEKPQYLGIVFDVKGPTIRHKAFNDYKAHRKPMPEDLEVQVPVLKKAISALRIPCFEYEEYEADDVLGSLARLATAKNMETVIISTDKDLLQLVDSTTSIYNPAKEIHLDDKAVEGYFGANPSQVVDVLSLWGDPSDNIPGVPGIGEKTAKALIKEFGSLDNLLRNLSRIKKPRLREKIEQNLDKLELSRKLVTIERKLDLPLDLNSLLLREPDYSEVTKLFQELEFTSFLAEYIRPIRKEEKTYQAIFNETEVCALVEQIKQAKNLAIDTETDSPSPVRAHLVGLSFSLEPGKAYYLPLGHEYEGAPRQVPKPKALRLLAEVLEHPEIKKSGQNIKYDLIMLRREGIALRGIDLDSMVLSYLLEPNWGKHNLDRLALSYLQFKTIAYNEVAGKGKSEVTLDKVSVERVTPYACQDADLSLELTALLWPKVQERKLDKLYREIEQPLIEVLADMEVSGVKVDRSSLQALSSEFAQDLARLEKKIYELSGEEFNINSPQQLAKILFHKLNLPPSKKTKITRGFSTAIDTLQELAPLHPLAQLILEYRTVVKLKSTYADALPLLINPETGRIHTSYNQTVAATGRLSSSEPNLQNIPARGEMGRRFRQAFIPEKGHLFLSADYSQIELRVLAHLSQDPALVDTFRRDQDVHQETAARVFGELSLIDMEEQRRRAKIINFSIIYGASAYSLAKGLGTSNSEAQRFIDRYYEKYPKVKEFLESKVAEATEKGFSETLFGRLRQVPELRQQDKLTQQAGRRMALNTPIQGTAADLMKKAMIDIWQELKNRHFKSKMILQVHDELVFEVPESELKAIEGLVKEKMKNVYSLSIPLKVHLGWGTNWAEAK
jgi:DNA polymerase-1